MDVKWISIATDMFNNRKMKQIQTLPEGDAIIVIWVHLLCLAGTINNDGLIYFSDQIPYTEEMLAAEFGKPINTVRLALGVFKRYGMIEVTDDIYCIKNWQKYQHSEALEGIRENNRNRQKRFRERQKIRIEQKSNVTDNVTQSVIVTPKKEIRDKERDIEGDKEGEINKETVTASEDADCRTDVQRIVDAWNAIESIPAIKSISSSSKRYKSLVARIREHGVDTVLEAIGKIKDSDFLTGRATDFVITIDWFVKPNNFPKVLEGNYSSRQKNAAGGGQQAERSMDMFEKIARGLA